MCVILRGVTEVIIKLLTAVRSLSTSLWNTGKGMSLQCTAAHWMPRAVSELPPRGTRQWKVTSAGERRFMKAEHSGRKHVMHLCGTEDSVWKYNQQARMNKERKV